MPQLIRLLRAKTLERIVGPKSGKTYTLRSSNSLAPLSLLPPAIPSLALTSRWITDSLCYVRPGRYSEYGFQSDLHWCDLCRPTSVHCGVDGFLPVIYGLALCKVRDFDFESPLEVSELDFGTGSRVPFSIPTWVMRKLSAIEAIATQRDTDRINRSP